MNVGVGADVGADVGVSVSIGLPAATVVALCVVGVAAAGDVSAGDVRLRARAGGVCVGFPPDFSVESPLHAGAPDDFDAFVPLVTQKCYVEITQQDLYIPDVIASGSPAMLSCPYRPTCDYPAA